MPRPPSSQALLDEGEGALQLRVARDVLLPVLPRLGVLEIGRCRQRVGVGERGDAPEGPGRRGAVVDGQVLRGLRVVPVADGQHPGFQLQRGGDALHRGHAVAADALVVEMDVDEARRHHVAGGVDGFPTGDPVLGDDDDRAVLDADVGVGVMPGFRINHPAVEDDEIVVMGDGWNRCGEESAGHCCRPDDPREIHC